MSSKITDISYLTDVIIGTDMLTNWTARDTTAAKGVLQRYESDSAGESASAFERFAEALEPGSRTEVTFSKFNGEQKGKIPRAGEKDYKIVFHKTAQSIPAHVGATQVNNREDLLTDRFLMEMRYREEIRDLKDQLREIQRQEKPSFGEAILGGILQDPHGIDKALMVAGNIIAMLKGRQPIMPAAAVNGHTPQAVAPNPTNTDTAETEAEQRVQTALQTLAEHEPQLIEVLEGLARFVSNPANRSTYEMIKPSILNA